MGVATLYGIRNCDTVKKARAWLEAQGVDYRFHDYKASGIEVERLNRWCRALGWEALLNRSGTTFRRLPDPQKQSLDPDRAMALMLAHPSMIKRPVVEVSDQLVVGFKPELYKSLKWS